MGKKKDKKKKKKQLQEEAATTQQTELIPPTKEEPGAEVFTGTFKEFKEMVYGLEPNSGAHYFTLPFGEVMANITSKRSLKKKGYPGPGAYTWKECQEDFENLGSDTEAAVESGEIDVEALQELLEAKYKRKEFKAHLEINTEFNREDIDAAIAEIPKKKATGVKLQSVMMQTLGMSAANVRATLEALLR